MLNTTELIKTCELINQRCVKVADTQHGSAWLFDKLVRFFEANTSATAITIPVIYNTPLLGVKGYATIGRAGELTMTKAE